MAFVHNNAADNGRSEGKWDTSFHIEEECEEEYEEGDAEEVEDADPFWWVLEEIIARRKVRSGTYKKRRGGQTQQKVSGHDVDTVHYYDDYYDWYDAYDEAFDFPVNGRGCGGSRKGAERYATNNTNNNNKNTNNTNSGKGKHDLAHATPPPKQHYYEYLCRWCAYDAYSKASSSASGFSSTTADGIHGNVTLCPNNVTSSSSTSTDALLYCAWEPREVLEDEGYASMCDAYDRRLLTEKARAAKDKALRCNNANGGDNDDDNKKCSLSPVVMAVESEADLMRIAKETSNAVKKVIADAIKDPWLQYADEDSITCDDNDDADDKGNNKKDVCARLNKRLLESPNELEAAIGLNKPETIEGIMKAFATEGFKIIDHTPVAMRPHAEKFMKRWEELKETHRPMLLYHGTPARNIPSIVARGLLVPGSPTATRGGRKGGGVIRVANGSAFGVGIYTTPKLSIARSYNDPPSYPPPTPSQAELKGRKLVKDKKELFLCIGLVATGKQRHAFETNAAQKKGSANHSVVASLAPPIFPITTTSAANKSVARPLLPNSKRQQTCKGANRGNERKGGGGRSRRGVTKKGAMLRETARKEMKTQQRRQMPAVSAQKGGGEGAAAGGEDSESEDTNHNAMNGGYMRVVLRRHIRALTHDPSVSYCVFYDDAMIIPLWLIGYEVIHTVHDREYRMATTAREREAHAEELVKEMKEDHHGVSGIPNLDTCVDKRRASYPHTLRFATRRSFAGRFDQSGTYVPNLRVVKSGRQPQSMK